MKKTIIAALLFLAIGDFTGATAPMQTGVNDTKVYVCTGNSSKRYHKTSSCRGLNNCQEEIISVTIEQAVKMGRTACKICYKK